MERRPFFANCTPYPYRLGKACSTTTHSYDYSISWAGLRARHPCIAADAYRSAILWSDVEDGRHAYQAGQKQSWFERRGAPGWLVILLIDIPGHTSAINKTALRYSRLIPQNSPDAKLCFGPVCSWASGAAWCLQGAGQRRRSGWRGFPGTLVGGVPCDHEWAYEMEKH